MSRLSITLIVVATAGCKGTPESSAAAPQNGPFEISRIAAPVVVSGPSSKPVETRLSASSDPLAISSVASPVAVSGIASAVAVSEISAPVAVSGVAAAIDVSAIAAPIKVSEIQSPVAVQFARPEIDPQRIESGTETSGSEATCDGSTECRKLVDGPFILTDLVFWGRSGSSDGTLFVSAENSPSRYRARWSFSFEQPKAEKWFTSGTVGSSQVTLGTQTSSANREIITGARIAVRSGEALYFNAFATRVFWSGFRP